MKTAVSIPDRLFHQAEELAQRLGKSRSQVYREALADYVARRDSKSVTALLDDVADATRGDPERWSAEAARGTLARSDW